MIDGVLPLLYDVFTDRTKERTIIEQTWGNGPITKRQEDHQIVRAESGARRQRSSEWGREIIEVPVGKSIIPIRIVRVVALTDPHSPIILPCLAIFKADISPTATRKPALFPA